MIYLRRDSSETKRKILTVCVRLFLEQGYKNTTVSQIVDEAGVARGSYLNLFPTKDRILLELTETMFGGQFGMARSIADTKLPPVYAYAVETAIQLTLTELNENLREIYIYPQVKFKNKREQARYTKLVRDVKRTLPYAKMVYETLIETYEYIETIPDEKSRQAHLKRMEKELFQEYKPQLKKLTFSQGKLLIKLIDRECNQSSYNLLKAYLGSFRAGFWNIFAGMFGASLKTEYDPKGKDAMTERVVVLVENGLI